MATAQLYTTREVTLMYEVVTLGNQVYGGFLAAEILSVPASDLIDENVNQAKKKNQTFFQQFLSGVHRIGISGDVSVEIMFTASEVRDQTYKAQVRLFLIMRKLGRSEQEVRSALDSYESAIASDFGSHLFDISFLKGDRLDAFEKTLQMIDTSCVMNLTKREDANITPMVAAGYVYYTYVPTPPEENMISEVTNVLSQYPGAAVMIQLIPASFTETEKNYVVQMNGAMNYALSQMMMRMMRPDRKFQQILEFYQGYQTNAAEEQFLFNFLICSSPAAAGDIVNKFIGVLEDPDQKTGTSYTAQRVDYRPDFSVGYAVLPWAANEQLLYHYRNPSFWNIANPTEYMRRFAQLGTIRELRPAFCLPIDDGRTTGIKIRKMQIVREKLNAAILDEGNFKLGVIRNSANTGDDSRQVHAGIPLDQFAKHALIVGMPGSGKTNFSLGILLQFWKKFHIPFFAIEPTKTEYRALLDAIPELQVFTPGKNGVSPFFINPFIPPAGVTVESYVPSLTDAFTAAFSMPEPLPNLFQAAINEAYTMYGWRKTSTRDDPNAKPFGMYEFIRIFRNDIQHMGYKGESKANIEAAGVVRLLSMIEQNSNIYDTIHTLPIEDLLQKPTVLELNAISNQQQKALIMALILILFVSYTKNNVSGDGKLKNILLIDEAHVLLKPDANSSDGPGAASSTVSALVNMIKEIRAYGTGIIIADQAPTAVGREVVNNTDIKIMFKLTGNDERDLIAGATNMDSLSYDLLATLGVGEALLFYGKLNSILDIGTYNVHNLADFRDVIGDSDVAGKNLYWKDESHTPLLVPHRECAQNYYCRKEGCLQCNLKMRSDADFIASRLIADKFYQIEDKKGLLQYLGPSLRKDIQSTAAGIPGIHVSKRFINCVKIKFLRKAILKNGFGLTFDEYEKIVSNRNFLMYPDPAGVSNRVAKQ